MQLGFWLLALAPLPWVVDAFFRWFWLWRQGGEAPPEEEKASPIAKVLVLVPSRQEGQRLEPTLRSVAAEAGDTQVRVWVILDGPDAAGESTAHQWGAQVLPKQPPGPTKGAALRFAAERLHEEIRQVDAVMVLDVGSQLAPGFFRGLAWPPGVSALQARLQGAGFGPGEAASLSERLAQDIWDVGKQKAGWSVRLRGTGTLFKPETFLALVQQLRTQVEDTEASLLLQAAGEQARLLPSAVVLDQKPETLQQASVQRARWFAGQLQLLCRHAPTLARLARRHPWQALAWVAALLSRPLTLSVPGRLLLGASLAWLAWRRGEIGFAGWGLAVALTAATEASWLLLRHPSALRSLLQLTWAWIRALWLVPRAFGQWLRARGRHR